MKHQTYLGGEGVVSLVQEKYHTPQKERLDEVTSLQRRALTQPLQWYQENAGTPRQAMAQAYLTGGYTMKEIAGFFCVHYSTVSRAEKWVEENSIKSCLVPPLPT